MTCRLALALRLLEQTADDIAELAGIEDETARQAAAPVRRRRAFFDRLDAVAFTIGIGLAVLGGVLFLALPLASRWWA